MTDMSKFAGRYKLVNSEHFDDYMKALNVGLATRTIGNTLKPVHEILVNGDQVTLKTISTFKNTEVAFKLGQETDETTIDGRKVKSTLTFEGGKLVQRQKATKADEKDSEVTRELTSDTELLVTMVIADPKVVCKRFYKRE